MFKITYLLFVFTKKQIAELFNEHFVHIADGVGEITDHYYGEGFYDHPSIKVIQANNGIKGEEVCLSLQITVATQIEELLSNVKRERLAGMRCSPRAL